MAVRQIHSDDKRERKRFAALERDLLGNDPLFFSDIIRDVDKRLSGRSPFFAEIEHTMFVASNGSDVARCAPMVNRRWQRDKGEDAGFIGYFAAAPGADAEVREMLLAAERWLVERDVTRAIAPFNGAAFLGLATLTDAFDEEPIFPLPWQPPHYPDMLEGAGYRPTCPFWVFEIDFSSEQYRTVSSRAIEDARCTVRPLDKRRWKEEMETLRAVFNETFRDEWEFHAMTTEEFRDLFDAFKSALDPRHILFAEVDGEIAGFCFGIPDWSSLFRSLDGKLGPLQILRLLRGAKPFDRAALMSIGVRDSHRGKHIGQTLAATLYRWYEELGHGGSFYSMVNDHNLASRRLAESFGGRGRIRYTAFDKPLTD